MRILLLIKRFDFGGAENHVRDLANSLVTNGHEVWVMSNKGKQATNLDPQVRFIPFHFIDFLFPFQLFYLVRFIRKKKVTIIHAHQRMPITLACLAGRIAGIPSVATVHGRTQYDLRAGLTRKVVSGVIYVSREVLFHSGRYKELDGKKMYIPNGISPVEKSLSSIRNRVYYASRIDKHHNSVISILLYEVMPELIKKFPDISLGILGDGKKMDELITNATLINSKHNKEVVFIAGYQPDIRSRLLDAALVMGAGRVALEALASGIPVLSLNRLHAGTFISLSNFEEMSRNNFVAVYAAPPTAEKLLFSLDMFFQNRENMEHETSEIKSLVLERFSMEQVTKKTISFYRQLLSC